MSFDSFLGDLNSKEADRKQFEADKPKRKAAYLAAIDQAFGHIAACLKSYSDAGQLRLSYGVGFSMDSDLGNIEVKVLTVSAGNRGARFTPIASMGFGCGAIIEIKPTVTGHFAGPSRDYTLVQIGNTGDVTDWKFRAPVAPRPVPVVRGRPSQGVAEPAYYDFTTESIQSVLQSVM